MRYVSVSVLSVLTLVLSSAAFADGAAPAAPTGGERHDEKIKVECKFKKDKHDDGTVCWAETTICHGGADATDGKGCRDGKDPIKIKCTNGFELFSRDASISLDDDTLWINARKDDRMAVISIANLFKDGDPRDCDKDEKDRFKRADLIISEGVCDCDRLVGACTFKKEKRDGGDHHDYDGTPLR